MEGGIPERLNHLMLLATSLLLLRAGIARGSIWVLFFALAFGFAFYDDAFTYHERVGGILARALDLPPVAHLRGKDVGELLAWGIAAAVLLVPFFLALRQRAPLADGDAGVMFVLFGALVLVAVGLDVIHGLVGVNVLGRLLGIVEDGGEMLVIAVACSYAFTLVREPTEA